MKQVKYQISKRKFLKLYVTIEEENSIKILNNMFYSEERKEKHYRKNVISIDKLKENGYEICDNSLLKQIEKNEKYEKLYIAIKKLPKRQRLIIECIFLQGYCLKDASLLLKLNYQSAYDLKKRALKRLKNILTENFK